MRTPESILTDAIFATAFAQDLMIADLLRRMRAYGDGLRPRSRTNLRQMITHLKSASRFADELWEELFDADAEYKWKNVQTWQDEANELARLILLWEDREPLPDVCNDIFKYIRSTKSEGVVNDVMLKQYYLNKTIPIREPEVGDRVISEKHGPGVLEFNTCGKNWAVELDTGDQIILNESQFTLL